jgi:hypothetical protein
MTTANVLISAEHTGGCALYFCKIALPPLGNHKFHRKIQALSVRQQRLRENKAQNVDTDRRDYTYNLIRISAGLYTKNLLARTAAEAGTSISCQFQRTCKRKTQKPPQMVLGVCQE